jgi:hypothetical protein
LNSQRDEKRPAVRRDETGTVVTALQLCAHEGRMLAAVCAEAGDAAAFATWRAAKSSWMQRTAQLLAEHFESETVDEFVRFDMTAAGPWQLARAAELQAVTNASELLRLLSASLGRR